MIDLVPMMVVAGVPWIFAGIFYLIKSILRRKNEHKN